MSDWYDTLDGLHDGVWQRLSRGVADRRAAARHPVLATAGLDGGAEARTVVLRHASRSGAMVDVHTDAASAKVAELRADPRATLLIWDAKARLQTRLRVTVGIMTGDAARPTWNTLSEGARGAYDVVPVPGTPIPAADAFDHVPDPGRLAVLRCEIHEIEALVLAPDHYRRAIWSRSDGWQGGWRAP